MKFQTHADISVAEKYNFLAKRQVTLKQLLDREAEYKGKNTTVQCKIVKKQDVSNFEVCPLNKIPVNVPNYNDRSFHKLKSAYKCMKQRVNKWKDLPASYNQVDMGNGQGALLEIC
eukprot:184328_1